MGENKVTQCQQEAEEVTQIMLDNYSKVLDREGKLQDLDSRAEELLDMSTTFSKTSKTLAQKKRWEDQKLRLVLAGVAVGVLVLIILAVALALSLPGAGTQVSGQAEVRASAPTNGSN
ncbi:vesicle-associated membrane protein 5 [Alligator sinensis]|uniref:Vesicle-associated membrane protein 5 n=1 Tax=Alligator sinensis TaxID=38654 RepID=A0A1U7S4X9_ALLSI|nr:vesicle-associated membrane protein 5 [Alligator sinensis]